MVNHNYIFLLSKHKTCYSCGHERYNVPARSKDFLPMIDGYINSVDITALFSIYGHVFLVHLVLLCSKDKLVTMGKY